MIKLPKDTYKRDLLHWVYSLNVEDCDQKEYELLKKVCTCYIYNGKHNFQIDRIKITESDKVLIQERDYIHSENKEIRARFIDVAYHIPCIIELCFLHMETIQEIKNGLQKVLIIGKS